MRICLKCSIDITHKRANAIYCGEKCRKSAEALRHYNKYKSNSGVYFLREYNTDNIKIGRTDNNLKYRLRNLQSGNPRELILMHFITSTQPDLIEAFHHTKFHHLKIQGEWFKDDGSITDYLTELKMSI